MIDRLLYLFRLLAQPRRRNLPWELQALKEARRAGDWYE